MKAAALEGSFYCSVPDCPFRTRTPIAWRKFVPAGALVAVLLIATVVIVGFLRRGEAEQVVKRAAPAPEVAARQAPSGGKPAPGDVAADGRAEQAAAPSAAPRAERPTTRPRTPSGADCTGVLSDTHRVICGDAALMILDRNVQLQYRAALATSADPRALIRASARFEAERDAAPPDPETLERLYRAWQQRLDAENGR